MERLAFGGASLIWNPRPARFGVSIDVVHDIIYGNCTSLGKIAVRRRWHPFGEQVVSVVHRRRRGGSDGSVARQTIKARGYNSASETAPSSMNKGDTMTPTAEEDQRNVSRLATEGDILDSETPQPGDLMCVTPGQTGRVGGLRAARRSFDEEDYATANLRHIQQKPAVNMHAGAPSALTSIALAAVPLVLIAPVMGFVTRCVVDYLHGHIEEEVGKRFAEMESWQARRRPRVKRRWQTILDEDRDEDELEEPFTTSVISEYQYQSDPWSVNARQPTISNGTPEMEHTWHEKETEEERKLRQRYDYEQIKKSYTKLEPMYEKFLADSGLSASGYWRGAGEN